MAELSDVQMLLGLESAFPTQGQANCPIVLSSRVRLARNLADYPFPGWADEPRRKEIFNHLADALRSVQGLEDAVLVEMDELSELHKQLLIERHFMSRELAGGGGAAGLMVSADKHLAIMINEEDHLRIQVLEHGLALDEAWSIGDAVDTQLEAAIDYAFSEELGYLTACPTNVGTGLRASVMLHLPGLLLSGYMEKVLRAMQPLGLAVRGLLGEGSEASGSVFQISNQQTLGESEPQLIARLKKVLQTLMVHEQYARECLMEKESEKMLDKAGRAYGTLRNAHIISSGEAMQMLSLLRFSIDLQLLPEKERSLVDRLFIECQPGHIAYLCNTNLEADARDRARAAYLRKHLQNLPHLDFSRGQNKS